MSKIFIDGVKIIDLKMNEDSRGSYNEIFKDIWGYAPKIKQWSVATSKKRAIRGMRVHFKHYDYNCLCQGKAVYILKDMRKGSPTEGKTQYVDLSAEKFQVVITPPGVAHGFYFYENSIFIVGITDYYDKNDELGFYYKDPDADIEWPGGKHIVSLKDKNSSSYLSLYPKVPAWKTTGINISD